MYPYSVYIFLFILCITLHHSSVQGLLSFELYGGGEKDGLVLVSHNNTMVPVCASEDQSLFDQVFASVVCQSLGFNVSHPMLMYPYKYISIGNVTRALRLTMVCQGDTECELHTTENDTYCPSSPFFVTHNILAVFCEDESDKYQQTLKTNTEDATVGRLEVLANNTWAPACISDTEIAFAEHACKSLNLPSTDARLYSNFYNGGETPVGALSMNTCGYDKNYTGGCRYNMYGRSCGNEFYSGLSCATATEGQLRLYGGLFGPHYGAVQIYHNGQWHGLGVDKSSSGLNEATVVCRTLGFSLNGVSGKLNSYKSLRWLSDIKCVNSNDRLPDCMGTPLSQIQTPTIGFGLTVSCGTGDNELRLEADGLLMMKRMGHWGTVCATSLGNLEASVICKAMNKSSSLAYKTSGSNNPKRTGPIWLTDFTCTSAHDNWENCLSFKYTKFRRKCTHDDDAFIRCRDLDKSSVRYRLSNSPVQDAGFVEMLVDNTWGYICGSSLTETEAKANCMALGKSCHGRITEKDAKVICRSMNLTSEHARVLPAKLFEPLQTEKMWLNQLNCTGTEASILDCPHNYLGDGSCADKRWGNEKLAIYCGIRDISDDYKLRLVGEFGKGRLEVKLFGEWGTVCDQGFDEEDAQVACGNMEFISIYGRILQKGSYVTNDSGHIWMTNISCYGFEGSFAKCEFSAVGRSGCNHSQDVGISCIEDPIDTEEDPTLAIVGIIIGCTAAFVFLIMAGCFIRSRLKSAPAGVTHTVKYDVPRDAYVAQPVLGTKS